jgi:hypothetical protein
MGGLDSTDLREPDLDKLTSLGSDCHSITGGLVGVERREGSGQVGFGDEAFEEQHHPIRCDLELLDPNPFRPEPFEVVGCEMHEERAPFPIAERDPNLARVEVQVEGLGVGPEEESSNIGDTGQDPLSAEAPVRFSEGKGDVGGDDGMLPGELMHKRSVAAESGEGPTRSLTGAEGFAKDLIGQESIIGHEGEEGRGERSVEGNYEAANDRHKGIAEGRYNGMT